MSRPISVKPDETVLWDLAFQGYDDNHIAEVIGCHQILISRRPDLRRVLAQARDEAAEAIVAAWRASSQGAAAGAGPGPAARRTGAGGPGAEDPADQSRCLTAK